MSSTRTQSQLCTATPISSLCSVFIFHFGHCLRQSPQSCIITVANCINLYRLSTHSSNLFVHWKKQSLGGILEKGVLFY